MTMMPAQDWTVAAIIPAYNLAPYIERCLQSVLNQTHPADEVILVDDGSTDDTVALARKFEPQVKVICQPSGGASAARNTGIKTATSMWLAFLDGDDTWLPEKLARQIDHLQRHPHLHWAAANYIRQTPTQDHPDIDPEIAQARLGRREEIDDYFRAYILGLQGWTGTMIIHREVFDRVGGFDTSLPRMNDIDMWFRIAYEVPAFGYLCEPLATYDMKVPNSIVKKHYEADLACCFLQKHCAMAQQKSRWKSFCPVAQCVISHWIGLLMSQGQGSSCRILLTQFKELFPSRIYRTTWLGSYIPKLWSRWQKIKRQHR